MFTGTSDLAPAMVLTNNAVTVSRPATTATWWSTARTVPSTTSIVLSALVSAWDAAFHTLTPKIVIGGTEYAASVTTSTTEDGATRFKYSFTVPATTTYKIKLSGTRTTGSNPFAVIDWNCHKRYLRELGEHGLPVVVVNPTAPVGELDAIRGNLLTMANAQSQGKYLFAGTNAR